MRRDAQPRLRRVAHALQVAVPQFDGLALEDDLEGIPHLAASFKHWRGTSGKQREMHLRKLATPDWSSLGAWHTQFARDRWDPSAVIARAPALARAIDRIAALA